MNDFVDTSRVNKDDTFDVIFLFEKIGFQVRGLGGGG